jgi:hypothetical protein
VVVEPLAACGVRLLLRPCEEEAVVVCDHMCVDDGKMMMKNPSPRVLQAV